MIEELLDELLIDEVLTDEVLIELAELLDVLLDELLDELLRLDELVELGLDALERLDAELLDPDDALCEELLGDELLDELDKDE